MYFLLGSAAGSEAACAAGAAAAGKGTTMTADQALALLKEGNRRFIADRPATLGVRPEHVATGAAAAEAPVRLEAEVELVEPMGSDTLVWVTVGEKPFRVRMDGQARVAPGDRIALGIDPGQASLFDAKTEERL